MTSYVKSWINLSHPALGNGVKYYFNEDEVCDSVTHKVQFNVNCQMISQEGYLIKYLWIFRSLEWRLREKEAEKAREEEEEEWRKERERERQERQLMREDRERSVQNIVCSLEWSQCMLWVKSVNKFQMLLVNSWIIFYNFLLISISGSGIWMESGGGRWSGMISFYLFIYFCK